jgi:RNA polymerase sigma factor (sigma-70 family)
MNRKSTFVFDPTNLNFLIKESGMPISAIEKCGISISNYIYGRHNPSLDALLRMADIFAVPIDFILGRCTKEECDAVRESFAKNFRILRKEDYEALILRKEKRFYIPKGYEAGYPYNLLDRIFTNPFDHIITEDEMNGLNKALSTLSSREREIIKYRYEDELYLDEIGKMYDIGKERVRQIEALAIRKLRHPCRSKLIKYGIDGVNAKEEYERKSHLLDNKELYLEEKDKRLREFEETLKAEAGKIEFEKDILYEPVIKDENLHEYLFIPIEDLDISVRAFNCLKRSNCNTVGDIVKRIRDGSIINIRNLGTKTIEDTIDRIKEATGLTWEEIMGEAIECDD